MSAPADTKRKFEQLDNDVVEIYRKLDKIQHTQRLHGNRLTKIEIKVTRLDTKVTNLDTKVTELDTKVTELDTKIDTKVGDLDRRLTAKLDEVIGLLEQRPSGRTALRWRR